MDVVTPLTTVKTDHEWVAYVVLRQKNTGKIHTIYFKDVCLMTAIEQVKDEIDDVQYSEDEP